MFERAELIYLDGAVHDPVFTRTFSALEGSSARLTASALGVFAVYLNGEPVSSRILAPGWECYEKRIGAVMYELSNLRSENTLEIYASRGWYSGKIMTGYKPEMQTDFPIAVIAELEYATPSGEAGYLATDGQFLASNSKIVSSDIYDGIIYDANYEDEWRSVSILDYNKDKFYPLDGVPVIEHESVSPIKVITTPRGEVVLDFGINMVGYPTLSLSAKRGDRVSLSFAEVLDADGNFYNENYRDAKCRYEYTCSEGEQTFKPLGTFFGYRYVRLNEYPHEYKDGEIISVWIHSDIKRVGYIDTDNELVCKLHENVIRGQRGNYVDIPTDCPQRDERLGWCGDAQVFIKSALYNYNCLDFFKKWLRDLRLSMSERGIVPRIVPLIDRYRGWRNFEGTAAWSDAVTVCPWELYLAYGDKEILTENVDAMQRYVDYLGTRTGDGYLWRGDDQFGDWLGLDAKEGSLKGSSSDDIIATAFYYHSTRILVSVMDALGMNSDKYDELSRKIRAAFIEEYEDKLATQTELTLAIHFGLTDDKIGLTQRLVKKIEAAGNRLETGFVGTPYILHALSDNGECDLAYKLLLREEYPSWLYCVKMGATTIWEHWDGIRPDGKMWSATMNSYNHYAYGACTDWMFSVAAGIRTDLLHPGYERVVIAPHPTSRLGRFSASYMTPHGEVSSSWIISDGNVSYSIKTAVPATLIINGVPREVDSGEYQFFEKLN